VECPECREPVEPEDRFCEACGTNLLLRRGSSVTAASSVRSGACTRCGEPAPDPGEEYCPGCGLRRRDGTERVELDLETLAGVSDRGRVHARNEDAVALGRLTRDGPTAAVVCDGVSSVRRPELASRTAADAGLDALLVGGGESGEQRMRAAVAAAAGAVAALDVAGVGDAPSCTFVSALVDGMDCGRPEITVGWVGDSRAYWLAPPDAAEPARLLTRDHAWAAERVAAGELDEAAAGGHPLAHAITRWLGADADAEPEVVTLRPSAAGAVLLCSDGLWNYRPDAADLAALALPALACGPLAAATALTALALEAGGRDNITVVVIPISLAFSTERSPS
jgi:serine/threonine protein phosphatase PrpC